MMKYFTGIFSCVLIFAACSTPEAVIDEPVEIEQEERIPEWYLSNRVSSSDSTLFNGYSMATAVDSAEAISLGNESAISNLRYEIDRFTEEVREAMNGEQHSRPQFIIKLRNSVQEIELTDSNFDREFAMRDDDVVQVYTRASIHRSEIIERLSEILSDEAFISALHSDPEVF